MSQTRATTQSGRQKSSSRYGHREKFQQQQGAIPDLLSNLPKPSKRTPSKSTPQKGVTVKKEDGILFVNVDDDGDQDVKQNIPTTEEIISELERAQELDCNAVFEIELRDRGLTDIPNFKKFPKTRILDLSSNKIKRIAYLFNIKDLRELKLYDNAIKIVEGLDDLKELSILQLQYNEISALGGALLNLKKLRQLRLDSNRLRKLLVKELCPCVQLTVLDLSFNNLDAIDAVVCLPNLEELFASNNQIKVLPDLGRCKKLMELRVSHNRLADANGLKGATNLHILDLSHNVLLGLKAVGKLSSLEYLNLSHNLLQEMQYFETSFPNVDVLDLSANRLGDADECLATLSKMAALSELTITDNPLSPDLLPSLVSARLPDLDLWDGQPLKRATGAKRPASGATPVMRPMSASTVISAKFVENQIAALKEIMEPFETKATSCYHSLRQSLDTLPRESPSTARLATDEESARPSSRCSRRSRIHEAQEFAKSMNFNA